MFFNHSVAHEEVENDSNKHEYHTPQSNIHAETHADVPAWVHTLPVPVAGMVSFFFILPRHVLIALALFLFVLISGSVYALSKHSSSAVSQAPTPENQAAAAVLAGKEVETSDDLPLAPESGVVIDPLEIDGGSFTVDGVTPEGSSFTSASGGFSAFGGIGGSSGGSGAGTVTLASATPSTTVVPQTTTPQPQTTTPQTSPTQTQNVFTPTTATTPIFATLSGTPSSVTNQTNTSITVGGSGVTQYRYRIDSSAFVGPFAVSQKINLTVGEGTHTLSVLGGDANGNFQSESNATRVVWAVDTTAPRATITGISTGVVSADTTTLTVGGQGVSHYRFKLDDGNYSTERGVSEPVVLSGLSVGTHTISVIGRDAIGNYQSENAPSTLSWTVDLDAPSIGVFDVIVEQSRATFQWTTSEPSDARLEVGLEDEAYVYTTSQHEDKTSTSHALSVSDLQSCSTYRYRVTSEDAGGLRAQQTGTITTDGCTGFAEVLAQTDKTVFYNVGGALHLLDSSGKGIELIVPAFFAGPNRNAQFQIKKLEKNAYVNALDGPADVSRVGDYMYRLSALEDVSTLISAFNQNLTVRIYYDPADLNGVDENSLSIRRHDGEKWNHLTGCVVNTDAHHVTCNTDHFSDFELFGERPTSLVGVSDTLSDSDLGASANHTIRYTSSTTVGAGEVIAMAFDDVADSFNGWENVIFSDVTFSGATLVQTCGTGTDEVTMTVRTDSENEGLRFTVCPSDVVSAGAKVVTIGNNRITNPNTTGTYTIKIRSGSDDNADEFAKTRVAILPNVKVTARVSPALTFIIEGVSAGENNANDSGTTSITTTPTSINWGELAPNVAKTARQDLKIATNARNGFTVSVYQDQNLTSSTGADIDLFKDGIDPGPTSWASPSETVGDEDTYGHFGVTSEDTTLSSGDTYGTALYDALGSITSPLEVFFHSGPANKQVGNKGETSVGFKIEVSSLQEAGTDYASTITYIATPIF